MSESDEIAPHNVARNESIGWIRFFEIVFGGIAKATMIVVAIVVLIFSFPESITSIPTTRKEALIVLLLAIIGIAGAILVFHFYPRRI